MKPLQRGDGVIVERFGGGCEHSLIFVPISTMPKPRAPAEKYHAKTPTYMSPEKPFLHVMRSHALFGEPSTKSELAAHGRLKGKPLKGPPSQ